MTCRRGEPWTAYADAELRRLLAAGERPERIAEQLGRSIRAIELRQERCRRPLKPEPVELTAEVRALLRSAEFDEVGWALPDVPSTVADKLQRGHLVEKRKGRWYLRPPAFKARLAGPSAPRA